MRINQITINFSLLLMLWPCLVFTAEPEIIATSVIDRAVVLKTADGRMKAFTVGDNVGDSGRSLEYVSENRVVLFEQGPDGPVRTIIEIGHATRTISPNLLPLIRPEQSEQNPGTGN